MNEQRQQLRKRLELLEDIRCWLLDRIDGSEETKGDDGLISDFIRKLDALSSETGAQPITDHEGRPMTYWGGKANEASPAATPNLQGSPALPEFIRKRLVQQCEDAEHPKGMSVHDGRTRATALDIRRALMAVETLERENADLCGQLAEWQKKAADVAVAWHGCIHRAEAAEAKLAEATKDAERYRWAKPVLSGDAECDAKTNQLAAGIMAGLDIDVIIDAALATKEST